MQSAPCPQNPKPPIPFKRELEREITRRALERMSSASKLAARNLGNTYLAEKVPLQKLGTSLNDVAKLRPTVYILASAIAASFPQSRDYWETAELNEYFRIDDLLTSCRLAIAKLYESAAKEDDKKRRDLLRILKRLIPFASNYKTQFIKIKTDIRKYKDGSMRRQLLQYKLLRNAPAYRSIAELAILNPDRTKEIDQIVDSSRLPMADRPKFASAAYAYKSGVENLRELIAELIWSPFGFADYLAAKVRIDLPDCEFYPPTGFQNPIIAGIGSRWIEGSPLNDDKVTAFSQVLTKFANGKATKEEVIFNAFNSCNHRNPVDANNLSAQVHAFMDLVLCSFDSHLGQYVAVNGKAICFDYARFLPPAIAYKGSNGKTYALLRSIFLCHPAAHWPIEDELIAIITKLDMDAVTEALGRAGLIKVAREDFAHSAQLYQDPNTAPEIKGALEHAWFSAIPIAAWEKAKQRVEAMQNTIAERQKSGKPTSIYHLFEAAMPDLFTLSKFYQKIEIFAPFSIGVKAATNPQLISLEDICNTMKDSNKYTPAEISEIEAALANLKKHACPFSQARLTMKI